MAIRIVSELLLLSDQKKPLKFACKQYLTGLCLPVHYQFIGAFKEPVMGTRDPFCTSYSGNKTTQLVASYVTKCDDFNVWTDDSQLYPLLVKDTKKKKKTLHILIAMHHIYLSLTFQYEGN